MTDSPAGAVTARALGIGRGFGWVRGGLGLFARAPGTWIGLTLCFLILYAVIAMLLSLIPGIGAVLATVLAPVFTAGVMVGCHELATGKALRVGHLVGGFNGGRMTQLLLVGAAWVVGSWIIVELVLPAMLAYSLGDESLAFAASRDGDTVGFSAPAAGMIGKLALPVLVVLALFLPLAMAVWFAPQLVQLRGVGALPAVRLSLVGCLRNILPFLAYGLGLLLLMLGAGLLAWILVAALTQLVGSGLVALIVLPLTALIFISVIPATWASAYVAYAEIYGDGGSGAAPTA